MTDRPSVTLLVNPAAGRHPAGRLAQRVAERLGRHCSVITVVAPDAAAARRLVATAAGEADAVVVLGGDGSVHHAVQELAGGEVALGVIPAGTGNDVADLLGTPGDPLEAADAVGRAVVEGRTRRIDLGRTDGSGTDQPRWWVTVLAAGFDAAVNARAEQMRWVRGPRRYDLAILREVAGLRSRPYRLTLDGAVCAVEAVLVSVGNGPQYGGGKRLVPSATLDDGHFTVCVVTAVTRRELLRLAPKLDVGAHVGHPAVTFHEATVVAIEADQLAYADGERLPGLPVTTTCVPAALTVVDPRPPG